MVIVSDNVTKYVKQQNKDNNISRLRKGKREEEGRLGVAKEFEEAIKSKGRGAEIRAGRGYTPRNKERTAESWDVNRGM